MPRSFACIISDAGREPLVAVAGQFAHSIEVLEDGILFDVSGLERLMGKPDRVAQKILQELQRHNVIGSVAVAQTVDTAMLLARRQPAQKHVELNTPKMFSQLPLADLAIEQDTLNVFNDLGLHSVEDLLALPADELVGRYGQQFRKVIDIIEQKGVSLLVPNIKENRVSWSFELDNPVEDFEQLIFVLNHGLERLFAQVEHCGFSTEYLHLQFRLRNKTEKSYEIKTSFPTLERAFWLKLINLRASLDPPEAIITAVDVTAHFAKPRPSQRGLYAVSRPEPESLLLTVGKLKKLVGEENVGVPVILDQRLAEPFGLDTSGGIAAGILETHAEKQGSGTKNVPVLRERRNRSANRAAEPQGIIAFTFYRPPVRAEVLVRDRQLIYLKTRYFAGHIANVSGVWKGNSKWWDNAWRTQEWDVELENGGGVYRLCKAGDEWFLLGEYD
jgi:protein ImuB